jgi:phosphoribosylcarboxyaminoimidazole (NCAIR) mutase
MFVTQPLNAISPIDAKFFELIIPIATFLTGTLSGIMLAGTGENAALAGSKAASAPKPVAAPEPKKEPVMDVIDEDEIG